MEPDAKAGMNRRRTMSGVLPLNDVLLNDVFEAGGKRTFT